MKNKLDKPRTDEEMKQAYLDAYDDDRLDAEFEKGVYRKEFEDRISKMIKDRINS